MNKLSRNKILLITLLSQSALVAPLFAYANSTLVHREKRSIIRGQIKKTDSGTEERTGCVWQPGATLRVKFLEGDEEVKAKVIYEASDWLKHAGIKLHFVDSGDAEIRITFNPDGGNWAHVGSCGPVLPQNVPTMNLGACIDTESSDEFRRTTVEHEFGHALGLVHEHLHPDAPIRWKKPDVYDYYKKSDGWDPAKVDGNIIATLTDEEIQTHYTVTPYDSKSIMHYFIDASITENNVEIPEPMFISESDINLISTFYPRAPLANNLQIDSGVVNQAFHGEYKNSANCLNGTVPLYFLVGFYVSKFIVKKCV